ncbi:putative secreted protein [Euzebya pacifica]|uniref:Putative secreted protein n=1 Tax=Euzebya pacifica TaxID=1608957 RepID=A0A346XRG1_9ACTN|nr:glycoside hydrolase family 16 protein [Euzebya pacifica]AXV04808.1 putative secreted protein [Euzebya pacifica]
MPDAIRRWFEPRRLVVVVAALLVLAVVTQDAARGACESLEFYRRREPGQFATVDRFDGDRLDDAAWTRCYWWDDDGCTNLGNDELQWYLPDQVQVADGMVRLVADDRPHTTDDGTRWSHRSGMITTGPAVHDGEPRLAFTYGEVEVRARVPSGSGLWPAIWMLPATEESRPEIDLMEVLGDSTDILRMHVHYVDGDGERQSLGQDVDVDDLSEDFHTYGVIWAPDRLEFLLDGRTVWEVTEPDAIPDEPMYLLINLAVGGEWAGPPGPDTTFPASFDVEDVVIRPRCGS